MEDNPSLKAMKDRIEAIHTENKERDRELKEKAEIAKNTKVLAKPEPKSKIITDKNVIEESLKDTVPAAPNKVDLKKALASLKLVLAKPRVIPEVTGAIIEPTDNSGETLKQRILRTHGGKPSDVPINSPYWGLKR